MPIAAREPFAVDSLVSLRALDYQNEVGKFASCRLMKRLHELDAGRVREGGIV